MAMLSLFTYISKSDRNVKSSEIQYVKKFLVDQFGTRNAQDLLYLYREILVKIIYPRHCPSDSRYWITTPDGTAYVLFGIAVRPMAISKRWNRKADGEFRMPLGISAVTIETIRAIFPVVAPTDLMRFWELTGMTS